MLVDHSNLLELVLVMDNTLILKEKEEVYSA